MNNNLPPLEACRYSAFISYSRKDISLASRLHESLERFKIPRSLQRKSTRNGKIPGSLYRVFQDIKEFSGGNSLTEEINAALAASYSMVVVCTPHSAMSQYVDLEIATFKGIGRSKRIICLLADPAPPCSDVQSLRDYFPPRLLAPVNDANSAAKGVDVFAIDFRAGQDDWPVAVMRIAARILGVDYEELNRRDLERRNRDRWALSLITVSLLMAFGLVAAWGWQQLGKAKAKAVIAEEMKQLAKKKTTEADTAVLEELRTKYKSDMERVKSLWDAGEIGKLRQLLQSYHENQLGKRAPLVRDEQWQGWWDKSHRELLVIPTDIVFDNLRISANGKLLIAWSSHTPIHHWSLVDGKPRGQISGNVVSAELHRDSEHIFVGSYGDSKVRVGKIMEWKPEAVREIEAFSRAYQIKINSQGNLVIADFAASLPIVEDPLDKAGLRLLAHNRRPPARQLEFPRPLQNPPLLAVAISENGLRVASAAEEGDIAVLQASDGKHLSTYREHRGAVRALAISPDGELVASYQLARRNLPDRTVPYEQGEIHVWSATTGARLSRRLAMTEEQYENGTRASSSEAELALHFLENGERLASCTAFGIDIVHIDSNRLVDRLLGHDDYVQTCAYSRDAGLLASSGRDKTIRVWRVPSPMQQQQVTNIHHGARITSLHYSGNGARLAAANSSGEIRIWDASSHQLLAKMSSPTDSQLDSVALNHEGTRAATVGRSDDGVLLWNIESQMLEKAFPPTYRLPAGPSEVHEWMKQVFFSGDASSLAIFDRQNARQPVRGLLGEGWTEVADLQTSKGPIVAIGSNDGRQVGLVTSEELVLKRANWENILTLPLTGMVCAATLSSDGSLLAYCDQEGNVKVTPIDAPEQTRVVGKFDGWPTHLSLSRDGRVLAASQAPRQCRPMKMDARDRVKVWNVDSREILGDWSDPGNYSAICLHPSGLRLAIAKEGEFLEFEILVVALPAPGVKLK